MRAVLSMLLVLLLTVHGPLSGAIPHGDADALHGFEESAEHGRHAHEADATPQHMSSIEIHSGDAAPAAGHHHMVGDTVTASAAVMSQSRKEGSKHVRFDDAALSSADEAPIPEPPIA